MAHTIEHDPIENGHLVVATGELDLAATPELSTILLMAAEAPGTTVVLDLAGVEFIDSTALGTILKAGSEIESAGKTLRVVCAGGPVRLPSSPVPCSATNTATVCAGTLAVPVSASQLAPLTTSSAPNS